MAGYAPVTKFAVTNAGEKGVVISGDVWDALVMRINMLSAPLFNPPQNAGSWSVGDNQICLDLSLMDQRLSNVEARLDSANAVANCVGNTVTITFTI